MRSIKTFLFALLLLPQLIIAAEYGDTRTVTVSQQGLGWYETDEPLPTEYSQTAGLCGTNTPTVMAQACQYQDHPAPDDFHPYLKYWRCYAQNDEFGLWEIISFVPHATQSTKYTCTLQLKDPCADYAGVEFTTDAFPDGNYPSYVCHSGNGMSNCRAVPSYTTQLDDGPISVTYTVAGDSCTDDMADPTYPDDSSSSSSDGSGQSSSDGSGQSSSDGSGQSSSESSGQSSSSSSDGGGSGGGNSSSSSNDSGQSSSSSSDGTGTGSSSSDGTGQSSSDSSGGGEGDGEGEGDCGPITIDGVTYIPDCDGEGEGSGGNCSEEEKTPPECTSDDPVQCAIQEHTWLTQCHQLLWREDLEGTDEYNDGDSLLDEDAEANTIIEHEDTSFTDGTDFDSTWLGSSGGSCPPDRTVNVLGGSIAFTFQWICDFAAAIRPIIIALAYVFGAIIYIRGFTN